uniref:Root abundant protein n=1 Tax=Triticum aestivum TaxID=4565 RepID=O04075_WHEAT|nr:root abundant protein [Triticum aestivum]
MTLNLSKSFSDALLFWTTSFLPHELFSHLVFTSASSMALIKVAFLRIRLIVNLDVGQRKTLEVHLAPDHIGSIHKCPVLVDNVNDDDEAAVVLAVVHQL